MDVITEWQSVNVLFGWMDGWMDHLLGIVNVKI